MRGDGLTYHIMHALRTALQTALRTAKASLPAVPASLALAVLLALASLVSSCRREPLHDMKSCLVLHLNVSLSHDDSTMIVKPKQPSLYKAVFYDPKTHDMVSEMYCGPEGGTVYGVRPGHYELLVYNYDTEYTRLKDEGNFNTACAYTERVNTKARGDDYVIQEPDHLLVARDSDVVVPYFTEQDSDFVIRAGLSTIMDSYSLRVDSLEGLENISGITVFLTGHSRSTLLGSGERSDKAATLRIPCGVNLREYCLYSEFCTFGKIPGSTGKAILNIYAQGYDGEVYSFEEDITEQYLNPDHRLRVVVHGKIHPKQDSGFEPRVDNWNTEIKDIPLE